MIKVLYCHGLGGDGLSRYGKVVKMFKEYGIEIVSPTVSYDMFINNVHIFNAMKEIAKDVDIIAGNSMGGYFAYHLGKACGKPTICFNPALSEITMSYNWFNRVTNYEVSENLKETLILMGTEDTTVNHTMGKIYLDKLGYNEDVIEYMEGESHTLSFFKEVEEGEEDKFPGIFPSIVKFTHENFEEYVES